MTSHSTWKLRVEDDRIEEFIDLRRLVGNRVIRAYLLEDVLKSGVVQRLKGSLRTPKDEFKDFDKFLILEANYEEKKFRILAESGVYDNLRIVGTDSAHLLDFTADELIDIFAAVLNEPEKHGVTLILSPESSVKS